MEAWLCLVGRGHSAKLCPNDVGFTTARAHDRLTPCRPFDCLGRKFAARGPAGESKPLERRA